jgi:tetratricopeptide (TPR) repeat protein
MQLAARWQSRALFVSSTFEDMQAERDHLQQFVFPELEERMRAHRIHLACIDLRWGVETTSVADREAKEATVLKVCLTEIDRCRPYFVVLLGDRYGWVPPMARVEAVTREAGVAIERSPCSVTELEIEYGALGSQQPMRPLFYFRRPLAYERMAEANIARYSDRTRSPGDFERLEALKARIRDRFPDRVREYTLEWDSEKSRPAGLAAFGDQVLADLWSEFRQELEEQPELENWRNEESNLLDAFVEECTRGYCGRADLQREILGQTAGAPDPLGLPGAAIVAESGAGKSALFASIVQRLAERNETLVLAHSAGISSRSVSVRNMLLRWCGLLADFLGVQDQSEEASGPDELKSHFLTLLREASERRRVAVVIDALDQFERTSEAKYLTWLPLRQDWPENAILIATTTPGTEAGALVAKGVKIVEVPALPAGDAEAIAQRICADFHKTLSPTVQAALLDKRRPDRKRATGNPLWLTLAVNELIVLDEDDFARLPSFSGTPEERLVKLMLHVIGTIPADVPGAYGYIYDRLERTYGGPFVRSLLGVLAVARFGLREKDLQALVPVIGGNPWPPRSFAAVRRALRTHLCERGGNGQWAFTHQQARSAALGRYCATPKAEVPLQRAVAGHLRSLQQGDTLRQETMYHLIQAGAESEAAAYWTMAEHDEELPAAFGILREHLLSSEQPSEALRFPLSFLTPAYGASESDPQGVTELMEHMAAERMLEFTEKTQLRHSSPEVLRELLNGMIEILRKRLLVDPYRAMDEQALYRALQNLGLLQTEQGEVDAALSTLNEAAEINDRHATLRKAAFERSRDGDPQIRYAQELLYHQNERDRMLNFQRIAQLHIAKQERDAARRSYERALEIAEYFLKRYPESELAATDIAMNLYSLGDLALRACEFEAAVQQYGTGLTHVEAAAKKKSSPLLLELMIAGHEGVARANIKLFRLQPALLHYGHALAALRESAPRDPGNLDWQWHFLQTNEEAADVLGLAHLSGCIDAAMQCYDNSLEACTALMGMGYQTAPLYRYVEHCYEQKSVIAEIQGNFLLARTHAKHAGQVAGWLAEKAAPRPGNGR